jgi:predicted transcriptional regulator
MMLSSEMSDVPTSKDSITVYLEPEIHEALKEWAKQQKRSKSFVAAEVIEEAVKAWKQSQEKS